MRCNICNKRRCVCGGKEFVLTAKPKQEPKTEPNIDDIIAKAENLDPSEYLFLSKDEIRYLRKHDMVEIVDKAEYQILYFAGHGIKLKTDYMGDMIKKALDNKGIDYENN